MEKVIPVDVLEDSLKHPITASKARIKTTGDIFDIEGVSLRLTEKILKTYKPNEIEMLMADLTPDYWTRLEHQYAGMAMQAIISKQTVGHKLNTITDLCCDIAHALVEKLKEKEK